MVAQCKLNTVQIRGFVITKDRFIIFVIGLDLLTILLLIMFINRLDLQQMKFTKKFNEQNIEPMDFTIMLTSMPKDEYFEGNEDVLRVRLWN